MANILLDEKRFLRIGEVCAVELKKIRAYCVGVYSDEVDELRFYYDESFKLIEGNEITFLKYVGNGLFIDLVSDSIIRMAIFAGDDIGTAQFLQMPLDEQTHLNELADDYDNVRIPTTKSGFVDTYNSLINNPFVLVYSEAPFLSIDTEMVNRFAGQSIEAVREKVKAAKIKAQHSLQDSGKEHKELIESLPDGVVRKI